MLERVRHTLQKAKLIPSGSPVVMAVSGGADSVALLHILWQLAPRLGFQLTAATLDHQLRGEESAADVLFVETICREWNIRLHKGQADVRRLALERHLSLEAAARVARYDFLAAVAHQVGADYVVVAHHAGDQAETVLMRLLRGTGLRGLGGMRLRAPMPGHPDIWLIRPLLNIARHQIDAYCQEHQLDPRHDSSNSDLTIWRNRLRHEVLPYLETISPNVEQSLARLADVAAVDDDYMEQQLRQLIESDAVRKTEQTIRLGRTFFRDLHPALQRRLLRWAGQQLGAVDDLDLAHVVDAVEIGLHGRQGALALLTGDVRLRVDYHAIVIESQSSPDIVPDIPLLSAGDEYPVTIPGLVTLEGWELVIDSRLSDTNEAVTRLAIPAGATITLRTRRAGDRFAPLGMKGHTQKLNRWMINRKISVKMREQIPILCIDDEVAAVVYGDPWTIADKFAVGNSDSSTIYFHFRQHS